MSARALWVFATWLIVFGQAAPSNREDPDWMNNLENDKLDDDEIEALSIDDSHTDQDLERELQSIEARKDTEKNVARSEESADGASDGNIKEKPEIIEGDIAVNPPSSSSQDDGDDIEKKSALRHLGNIWQDRKIPYVIDPIFPKETKELILKVMAEYMNQTCLKFIDVSSNPASVRTYLEIKPLSGCWSYVGRVFTGRQLLSIGQGCEYFGTITHELMHASGFYHEQSRSDRDDYVEIMWENINPNNTHNFRKYGTDTVQNFKTDYDYDSVMHYGNTAFSKNGKITIKPVKPGATIGQRGGFSKLDLQELNALYQCKTPGGGLSEWSDWGPCLGTGDGMYKERQRYCFDTDYSKCPGVNSRGLIFNRTTVSCTDAECKVKGHWSRWSSWTSCSTTRCGTYGSRTRSRTCTNPAPKCGGPFCSGSKNGTSSCYTGNCIGPDDCEFEKELAPICHWRAISGYPLTWTRVTGGTPSSNTGPSGDASNSFNGAGHYLYVESSSPAQQGQKARLCSKQFPGPAKKRFAFKYHSYAIPSTKLRVILSASASGEKVIWSTIGLERNEWLSQNLTIDVNEAFSVCLEYERGSDWRGDIAVDDLVFEDLGTDLCNPNPCQNQGTCSVLEGKPLCTCKSGYTGQNCETPVDNCASNPCLNGGSCTNGVGSFSCQCAAGYTGTRCETEVNPCKPTNPCQNQGTCSASQGKYTCFCLSGYTGKNCETIVDNCASNPCLNGGSCTNSVGSFSCQCAAGYTGPTCDTVVDNCASNPCLNGGSCTNGVGSFSCQCAAGFTGTRCETDINECLSNPCHNAGLCIDQVNGYRCNCFAGFTGSHCEIDYDECGSQPCKNGATCIDKVDDFTCICADGFTGRLCESFIPTTEPPTTTTRPPTTTTRPPTTTTRPPTTTTQPPTTTTRPPTTTTQPPTTTTQPPTTTTRPPTTTTRPPTTTTQPPTTTRPPTTTTRPPTTTTQPPTTTTRPPTTTTQPPTTTTRPPTTTTRPPTTTTRPPTTTTRPPTTTSRPPTTTTQPPTTTTRPPTTTTQPPTTTTRPPTTTTQPPTTTTQSPTTTMKPQAFDDLLSCDFECNTCSWKQENSKDVFDWTRKDGRTPSYVTGPSFDHTTAKAGFYMFTESSVPRRPNHNAILYTPKMNSDGRKRCMDFYYHMYGQGIGSLIVTIEHGGQKYEVFKKSGNQGNTWHRGQATLDVPAGNQFKVYIESKRGSNYQGDTAIDDIRVWKGGCTGLSTPSVLACPIESTVRFCEWSQRSDDDGNWRLKRARRRWYGDTIGADDDEKDDGMTNKADGMAVEDSFNGVRRRARCRNGPRQALSSKKDSFAVFKGRKYINKEVAVLQSKSITTKEETCLRFYAFMCGKTIGSLSVAQVNENTGSRQVLKRLSGDQKDHWFETETNIPVGSDFKIEISATQGRRALIAIDEIQVSPGKCKFYKNLFMCDFSAGNCGFKQEKNDECTWKIVKSAQGKALHWDINDCHGGHYQHHFHAQLSKVFNIPPRGSCLTIEYSHHTRSSCFLDVTMEDATPNWYGRKLKSKDTKVYFSKTKSGKSTAYVTLPPSRGGCAPNKVYVEVELEYGECENFSINSMSLREGICGNV